MSFFEYQKNLVQRFVVQCYFQLVGYEEYFTF